uniref:Ab1-021 n=1 Tax=Rattus norvegicus TaxID=10116 RepID=Q7TMB9_RAT|nr:liver regeneration protein lrryan [Rattus norvegicus]AAP92534.1 Ab1-021 [Rattus norvegicus]|eukprot:NP_872280.1 Serine protease inhibitor [Rattus norvegicus]
MAHWGRDTLSHEDHGKGRQLHSLTLASSNTDFALSLYKKLALRNPDKNVVFSPLSISAALTILSLGAKDSTMEEILEGLKFNLTEITEEEIHQGFGHLLQRLSQPEDQVEINTGSALFIDKEQPILSEFQEKTRALYQAEAFIADFKQPNEAKKLINDYVSNQTQGKIAELFSDLEERTSMVLVNYLLFKGKMQQVESSLQPETLKKWKDSLIPRIINDLRMPKFSISTDYSLKEVLPELGIKKVFSQQADLSRITGTKDLYVSQVVHKAVLDVDETGTEATAATGVATVIRRQPRTLNFNRPFMVVITDMDSQSILFVAKITNPKRPVKVPMMKLEDLTTPYVQDEELNCTVVELKYTGNASALFILPDQGKMQQVEASLQPETLRRWKDSLRPSMIDELYPPKFSISADYSVEECRAPSNGEQRVLYSKGLFPEESCCRMSFLLARRWARDVGCETEEVLPELGIKEVFSTQADLSGITGDKDLTVSQEAGAGGMLNPPLAASILAVPSEDVEKLPVRKLLPLPTAILQFVVVHKAVLDVAETGTEAAAATGVKLVPMSAKLDPLIIVFNRPFLIIMSDTETEIAPFWPRYLTPNEIRTSQGLTLLPRH